MCPMEAYLFLVRPLQVKAQKHFSSEIHAQLSSWCKCRMNCARQTVAVLLLSDWNMIVYLENDYQKNTTN